MILVPYDIQAFKKELQAIESAFAADDFEDLNSFSNRIMSNCTMVRNPDLILAGFVLKDVNSMLLALKNSTRVRPLTSAKSSLELLIKRIRETAVIGVKNSQIWDAYNGTLKILRNSILDDNETKAYTTEQPELTLEFLLSLIDFLEKNISNLSKPNNLIPTIVLEANRLLSSYGTNMRTTRIRALLVALNNVDNYVVQDAVTGSFLLPGVIDVVTSFAGRVVAISKVQTEELSDTEAADVLLQEMLFKWRELYMLFNDSNIYQIGGSVGRKKQPKINIPESAKEKLADVVTKNLEEEIKKVK